MRNLTLCVLMILLVSTVTATNHFGGITVSNSVGGTPAYTCRTQDQWDELGRNAKNAGFPSLRIIGFDCNALYMASNAASSQGLTVLPGIYVQGTVASSDADIRRDLQSFHEAYQRYGSSLYPELTVGNEVNDTPQNIMGKIREVRDQLRSWGIETPVSTVHTWVNIVNDPVFCEGDFVGANAHAFFDGHVTADLAGSFLSNTVVPRLRSSCPGKGIIITETGWPSRGASIGVATPSLEAEASALSSLNCASRDDNSISVYAFEYDDQIWKGNDNERSFGIFGKINIGDVLGAC